MPSEPIVLGAGMSVQFLVEPEESDGSVSVFRCDFEPEAKIPVPHSHDAFNETIYGLEGEMTWTVDGVEHAIGAGDVVFIPRGAVHGFAVAGHGNASILAVASPGRFGPAYFSDIRDAVAAMAGRPPDMQAIAAVMRRHGLTPALPTVAGVSTPD